MALRAPRSFHRRLAIFFVLSVLITCVVLSFAALWIMRQVQVRNAKEAAIRHGQVALRLVSETLPPAYRAERIPAEVIRALGLYVRERNLEIVVVTEERSYSSSPQITMADVPSRLLQDGGLDVDEVKLGEGRYIVARSPTAAIETLGSTSIDGIFVFNSLESSLESLKQLGQVLFLVSSIVVVGAVFVGRLVARRILRPVKAVSEAAQDLAAGVLSRRVLARRGDEFQALVTTFNDMAEVLQRKIVALVRSEERERRFTAVVAHDLHSVVSALSLEAQSLSEQVVDLPSEAREFAELIATDIERLSTLTTDLMEIARLDDGEIAIEAEWIDLRTLLVDLTWQHRWGGRVHVSGRDLQVYSDRRMLSRVLANLIENALKHGGNEAWVALDDEHGGKLAVRDEGAGIPTADLSRVFERFYRGRSSSSVPGSGLGLALVVEYARVLGIEIKIQSREGEGTTAILEFQGSDPGVPGGEFPSPRSSAPKTVSTETED